MEGQVLPSLEEIGRDEMLFPLEVFVNGSLELRPRQPVLGPGVGGLEATTDLVLALGAGVEMLQALADAVFDALVVAGLEMQAVELLFRAPVATVECVAASKADSGGHRCAVQEREAHYQACWQGFLQLIEERALQVGRAAALEVSGRIEAIERIHETDIELGTAEYSHLDAGFGDPPPFPVHLLALLRRESLQEMFEVPIAMVVPVELAVASRQEALGAP